MLLITKPVVDLSSLEYRACYWANYRDNGLMMDSLWRERNGYGDTGLTIMIWNDQQESTRDLIGWSLLTKTKTTGDLAVSRYIKSRSKYTAQFWVKRQFRGQGYGKILLDEVYNHDPRPHVFPHDEKSGKLFKGRPVCTQKGTRYWMRKAS